MSVSHRPAPLSSPGTGAARTPTAPAPSLVLSAERFLVLSAEKTLARLQLISTPQRITWALRAAWKGEDVWDSVRSRIGWHRVEEILITQPDKGRILLRVSAPDESSQRDSSYVLSSATQRYLSRGIPSQDQIPNEPAGGIQHFKVIGFDFTVTASVSGTPPPHFRERLQSLCDEVHAVLADSRLSEAEKTAHLHTAVSAVCTQGEPCPAGKVWNTLNLCILFFLAAAALLVATGIQHLRWEKSVASIDAAPGIEIISHTTRWGRRQIEILRDPLAQPLGELLAAAGLTVEEVDVRERPFVSGESMFVAARAAQPSAPSAPPPAPKDDTASQLNARALSSVRLDMVRALLELPPDLELTLKDERLSARGTLTEPTYTRLARAAHRISWLRTVDYSQVRDLTGENITALKEGLEKTSVEFLPASSILPEASKLRLQSIASELRLLANETRLKQQTVTLQFYAYHRDVDPPTLTRRIETLRQTLSRQEVPASWFDSSSGLLDARGPNSVSLRINIQSPETAP